MARTKVTRASKSTKRPLPNQGAAAEMAELVEARKVLRLVQAIFYDEGQLETAGPSGGKSVDILLEALRTARQEFEDMIIEDGPEPNWKHGHRAARRCELAVALYEYRTAFGWSAEETDNEAS